MNLRRLFRSKESRANWETQKIGEREIQILDCRKYVLSGVYYTSKREVAELYVRLRDWQGAGLGDRYPNSSTAFSSTVELPLNRNEYMPDGPLFKATQMEDKVDVYNFGRSLFVCHSWTGNLLLRADYFREGDWLRCRTLHPTPELGLGRYVERWLEYIFKSHCLNMVCPHPLPTTVKTRAVDIFAYSFAWFGRRAWFATYEETIGIYNSARYDFEC